MSRPPLIRLPQNLPGVSEYDRDLGMVVTVDSQASFDEVCKRLSAVGFTATQDTSDSVVYTKRKKLGPVEVLAIVVGLFMFLLPGLVYMMWWASKGQPTVIVSKP